MWSNKKKKILTEDDLPQKIVLLKYVAFKIYHKHHDVFTVNTSSTSSFPDSDVNDVTDDGSPTKVSTTKIRSTILSQNKILFWVKTNKEIKNLY